MKERLCVLNVFFIMFLGVVCIWFIELIAKCKPVAPARASCSAVPLPEKMPKSAGVKTPLDGNIHA